MKKLTFGYRDHLRRFMSQIVMLAMVMMVVGSSLGCAAVVWPLEIGKTIEGMQQAANGLPGTFAYMSETSKIVVLGWAQGAGKYAFILLDQSGELVQIKDICNANCMKWETAAEFLKWLEANGWNNVPAGLLPAGLVSAIRQTAFIASLGSRAMPSLLFLPMVILETNPIDLLNPMIGS
jgi:hypothetical protein